MLNARDFGAVGDGHADDTAALQRAVDACCGPGDPRTVGRVATQSLLVPAGQYRLTAPLRIAGVNGFTLRGEGLSTRFLPAARARSALELAGVAYSVFSDFSVAGTGSEDLDSGIYLYWDPRETVRGTTTNVLERIQLGGLRCVTGLQIGVMPAQSVQCDTTYLSCLDLKGSWGPAATGRWWQYGLRVGNGAWGNNLVHDAAHLSLDRWGVGCHVAASQLCLTGAAFGDNGCDLRLDCQGYFRLSGFRSEGSGRFVSTGLGSGTWGAWTFEDGVWLGGRQQPGAWLTFGPGGHVALRNLALAGLRSAPVVTGNSFRPWAVTAEGLTVAGYGPEQVFAPGPHGRVDLRRYVRTDAAGEVLALLP